MTRSIWKIPFIDQYIYKKSVNNVLTYITIKSRNSTILKQFVGKKFKIYNGKKFTKTTISNDMIGHKFGEFSLSKKRHIYKQKKKTWDKKLILLFNV